ncbi:MAG TPA: succinate CoA transferase [Gemmatimonadales bacterium]|nr:succinate CoA transferase [Gemmatimonadales bacterium]
MKSYGRFPIRSAEEAAELISHGATLGIGGFTPPGCPLAVPRALAKRARALHERGEPFQVRILSGAEGGPAVDVDLPQADAVSFRMPFQLEKPCRDAINAGKIDFADVHLSHCSQQLFEGFFGKIDVAVIEASDISDDGRVFFTTSIGNAPTYLQLAEKVVIEINRHHPARVREFSDILILPLPPHREPIPIRHPLDRIGVPYAMVDPAKVVAIVETDEPSTRVPPRQPDAASKKIAEHLVGFFLDELAAGRLPREFLPLQSGVGNIGNALMAGLGEHPDLPAFTVYTEVFQDSCVDLMRSGRLIGASSTALTLCEAKLQEIYEDLDYFGSRIVLRPQEISNNPTVIRQLGVIATNTALEVDIYGHVNSSHVCGTQMMNGIGGAGDFERNARLAVFVCPSVAKGGRVSAIVPFASHVDHSEHSVHVVVTEQGIADLRGLGPAERARRLIDRCAHPAYRDYLHRYVEGSRTGHIRHDLTRCFELHRNLIEHGAMLPDLELKQFGPVTRGESNGAVRRVVGTAS